MVLLWLTLASACLASTLPVVDLGYERHQALSYNVCYSSVTVGDLGRPFLALAFNVSNLVSRAPAVSIALITFAMQLLPWETYDSGHRLPPK